MTVHSRYSNIGNPLDVRERTLRGAVTFKSDYSRKSAPPSKPRNLTNAKLNLDKRASGGLYPISESHRESLHIDDHIMHADDTSSFMRYRRSII